MATETLENLSARVGSLERQIADIQRANTGEHSGTIGRTQPDFLDRFFGIFSNNPDFDKMTEAIEAEREQEREIARAQFDCAE